MKQRRTTKPADEAIWFAGGERVAEVGLLRARYERQFFPRHSHDGFVSCVNERGARRASPGAPMFRFGHRGRFQVARTLVVELEGISTEAPRPS
jgi:hypothetical protein